MVKILPALVLLPLLTLLPFLSAQSAPAPDEIIWKRFESWAASLPALPPGERVSMRDRYLASLSREGVDQTEAARRYERVNAIRRGSSDRERVYWDAAFKSGGGPDDALLLLQEAVSQRKPGRALDAGMGRGRNTIYLASLGWEATGYDMSADALQVAQAYAAKAGVQIRTVEARHDSFEFGEGQWDLIVCAYCYMMPNEPHWPEVFWKALKPGGLVVFQTSVGKRQTVAELAGLWKRFRLLRVEDMDAGAVANDWTPSRTNPTVKLVARKE
jgi:2-polyprenyl-3-methyl-5-hydroxy-6-metoxy-1,4-benzoquinol methylase